MYFTNIDRNSPIFKKCMEFAQKLSEDTYYSDCRAATSKGDIIRNHKNSKLSELLVSAYISKKYGCTLKPDFEIYDKKDKNWAADLPYKDKGFTEFPYNVHVKSTDNIAIKRVGHKSWVFQLANKDGQGGRDSLLKSESENDWVAFCYVNEKETYFTVFLEWLMPWKEVINKNLLKDPFYNKFKGIKLCIYEDDLKECKNEFQSSEEVLRCN